MGTRGYTGFITNGLELFAYQQYDSYPDGVGKDVLEWARGITNWEQVKDQVLALKVVDEGESPTPGQLEDLGPNYHQNVSTGADWYAYLRETQGNPALILQSGYIANRDAHGADDWDIEYSWVVDLDKGEFRGYEGNLTGPEISNYPLNNLPTTAEFLKGFEG